jgi:MFS family permease
MERKWWTLLAVSVATFMLLLDITVVNVALPSIRQDLGASFTDLQWVVDAYALTLAALVLPAGSLADRLGRRRLFAAGLVIFSVASLLCALAPDPTLLSLARALQGAGGAVLFAVSLALVAQEFPAGRQRATATAPPSASPSRSARWWAGRSPTRWAGRRSSTSTSRSGLWRWRSPG